MPPKDYFPPSLIPLIPILVWAANNIKPINPGWGYGAKKIVTDNWPPPYSLPPDFEPPEWTKQPAAPPQGMSDSKPAEKDRSQQEAENAKEYVTDLVYPWG